MMLSKRWYLGVKENISMVHNAFIDQVNQLSQANTPFLFIVDFEKKFPRVYELDEAKEKGFRFSINGFTNCANKEKTALNTAIKSTPMPKEAYVRAFNRVKAAIEHGDSFLLNLTFPTKIELNCGLEDIFYQAKAPYKLFKEDAFVVFSPESFVKIKDDHIYTFPMKGTIDAKLPNAWEKLQKNTKELFEHNTIVDLMRNDLSMVAKGVSVSAFRYPERLITARGELLQTSTKIEAKLAPDWRTRLGEIILTLLPAGSVSGAPKEKTCAIIKEVEKVERGNYTGVFGVFDGKNLDSGVMIRYIEQKKGSPIFEVVVELQR